MKNRILSFITILAAATSVLPQGTWTWQNPWPQGNDLYFIHVFGNGDILAAGNLGTIIRSSDNGLSWDVQPYAFGTGDHKIEHMQFVDDNTGWAVDEHLRGSYKKLYYTNDGGQSWEERTMPDGSVGALFALDRQIAWISTGVSASLSHTTDGGFTWTKHDVASNQDFTAGNVFFLDQNRGWAVGYDLVGSTDYGKIYQTVDGGVTWSELYTNPERNTAVGQVFFVDENTGWVGGTDGLIMSTTDGGQTWTTQFQRPGTNYAILDIFFYDENNGIAVGSDDRVRIDNEFVYRGLVVTTSDGGLTWEIRDSRTKSWIRDIYPVSDSTIWASGNGGVLIKSEDRGQSWTEISKGTTTALLNCVTFSDENTGWVGGGGGGQFMKTEDGGENWLVAGYGEHPVTVLQFLDPDNGYRIESHGQTYRTRDGGESWELTDILGRDGLYQNGCFADTAHGWLSWNYLGDGYVKKTSDGAKSWQTVLSVPGVWLWESDFVNTKTGWVCGGDNVTISDQQGYIFKTTDGGLTWQEQIGEVPEPLYEIDFIDENTGWSVGANGTMLATTDGGDTWNPVDIPLTETLVDVDFLDANTGWIIGNDGVARTLDAGQTWETFTMPDGQSWLYGAAYFTNADNGWLVGSLGHILKFDGGVTTSVAAEESTLQLPTDAMLHQNYPNPFNPETTITYALPEASEVKINIFNALGQVVRGLEMGVQPAGNHAVHWDGKNDDSARVSSGIYYYQMVAGGFRQVRKMLLLR